jgi:excinuclease UvrABC nuclease subunit
MYMGRAERLDRRLSGHEKLDRAKRLGANELWVHQPMVGDPIPYWQVESRLIKRYSPPLNENEPSPFPPLGALFGLGQAR